MIKAYNTLFLNAHKCHNGNYLHIEYFFHSRHCFGFLTNSYFFMFITMCFLGTKYYHFYVHILYDQCSKSFHGHYNLNLSDILYQSRFKYVMYASNHNIPVPISIFKWHKKSNQKFANSVSNIFIWFYFFLCFIPSLFYKLSYVYIY